MSYGSRFRVKIGDVGDRTAPRDKTRQISSALIAGAYEKQPNADPFALAVAG